MKRLVTMAAAASLLGGQMAMAQPGPDHGGRDMHRAAPVAKAGHQAVRADHQAVRADHQAVRADHRTVASVRDQPHWSRGDRLPHGYIGHQAVRVDWRARHLRQPPAGYEWVQYDNRYLLVALTSGLIASVILNAEMGQ